MAVIYMTHPVHGAKVATMDLEAEADEQNGWTRYNLDEASEPEEATNPLIVKRKYTRRVETEGV